MRDFHFRAIFKDKQNLSLRRQCSRPSKIKLEKRTLGWMIYNVQAYRNPRWRLVIEMHVLRFGNKLNEEVCRGFIFANFLIHYISW